MATETVILAPRKGEPAEGTTEVTRYGPGARAARAGGLLFGGLALGVSTIVIPTVHLISTWLIPLLGAGVAVYIYRVRARVGPITGTCPSCGEVMNIESPGAVADEAVWVRCDRCAHPLELRLREG